MLPICALRLEASMLTHGAGPMLTISFHDYN